MKRRSRLLRQIVRALVPSEPELEPEDGRRVEDEVVAFVDAQLGSLAPPLRIPVSCALVGVDWLAVARFGRPCVALDTPRCRRYLGAWDRAPLAPCRDLVRLLRSCTLLAYLDHPLVARRLEAAAALEAGS